MKTVSLEITYDPELPEAVGGRHIPAEVNYLTLCGIGEEGVKSKIVKKKINCQHCMDIVNIVRRYL